MKQIVAINASPRTSWNTGTLIRADGLIIGPTKVMICGDTLQVNDYDKYDWTIFDPEAKKARHENVFPEEKQKAFQFGAEMVGK